MNNIIQMSERLANMIAAGEVVNRPASVIKELVENSLDAKATIISIEVIGFGMEMIKVTDNGIGMSKSDAHLAFSRHATSKIINEQDLNHIGTLGFRGEAIPAISAVSKMILRTREEGYEGYEVIYHGGKLVSSGICSLNIGTEITVSELFYNTPARYKYIKSDIAERNAILDLFDNLALARPEVSFVLTMDEKVIKRTSGTSDFKDTLASIYGGEFVKNLVYFKKEFQKNTIEGYLVDFSITRARKKDISIFVNSRCIKSIALQQAVIDGYHSYIMVGRYPIACIFINVDYSLVDVNVHPQKTEIRLANESVLSYQISRYIKEALSKEIHKTNEALLIDKKETIKNNVVQEEMFINKTHDKPGMIVTTKVNGLDSEIPKVLQNLIIEDACEGISTSDKFISKLPEFYYIGTLGGTYLLFQNKQALYLLDQHAAAERIRYEKYLEVITPIPITKKMIFSYSSRASESEKEIIKENIENLKTIGFHFNERAELIEMPIWVDDKELDEIIEQLIINVQESMGFDYLKFKDEFAKKIACKGAIKANQYISRVEVESLMQQLEKTNNPYTCPHGRPVFIEITYHEIEKLFKRIV